MTTSPNEKPQHSVEVNLGDRSYTIRIGYRVLASLGQAVRDVGRVSRAFLIVDANVVEPYGHLAQQSLEREGIRTDLLAVPAGEGSKSIETATHLWRELVLRGADRKSFVVALGGGMVGDLAGFVAATYARGIPFFQVPTSLLAQVDSSVGGKVAVNLPEAKNMVGAFYQPRGVLIDIAALETLPKREYHSGLAEVVKYGVILDAEFFAFLEGNTDGLRQRDPALLQTVVARCCRLKADIVEKDEKEETGLRAVLNYGHTFGHAVETLTGYEAFLHGEAVAIGMMCAARLAERLEMVGPELVKRQQNLLEALELPTRLPKLDIPSMIAVMQHDKKVQHGQLRFVLPRALGHVEVVGGVPAEIVGQVLQEMMA